MIDYHPQVWEAQCWCRPPGSDQSWLSNSTQRRRRILGCAVVASHTDCGTDVELAAVVVIAVVVAALPYWRMGQSLERNTLQEG